MLGRQSYIPDQLVGVAAVRVEVPDALGRAPVAEEEHERVDAFLVVIVEAIEISIGTKSQNYAHTPRTTLWLAY